jgi:hypothetical protein
VPRPITTQVELETEQPVWLDDLLAHESIETSPRGSVELTLEGYGQYWLRVRREDRREL